MVLQCQIKYGAGTLPRKNDMVAQGLNLTERLVARDTTACRGDRRTMAVQVMYLDTPYLDGQRALRATRTTLIPKQN